VEEYVRVEALTPDEVARIDSATRRVLAETGVQFKSGKALDIFGAAGAGVDKALGRVRIPAPLLDQALASCSNHFRLWDRDGSACIDLMDGQVRGHNVGGCVRIFDARQGAVRDATEHDLEELTVLIDGLENIHVCRPVVYPKEFPTQLRDIYTAATMLQHTDKPYGVTAYSPLNQSLILELLCAVAGSLERLAAKPFIWGSVCPDSPLSYSENTADMLIRYAEVGLPVAISGGEICGGTSPVTLAGTLVEQNAEFLAGLVLVQIVRPGIDAKYTTRPIPMDMRTGTAAFGAVEMGMMASAIVQLARRYRVCSDVYGLGTSARQLDEQAGYEKAVNGLLVALTGADLVAAAGLLEDALTSSAEQLVIDNEILGMIFRAVRGIEMTPEALAVEVIERVGPGGNYLTDEHTRAHMRREYYQAKLGYRAGSASWEAGGYKTIVDAARERAQKILDTREQKGLRPELTAEIRRILKHASESTELH
jgi:trimethylamine--corrinoid protein Co-methyltransferase